MFTEEISHLHLGWPEGELINNKLDYPFKQKYYHLFTFVYASYEISPFY